MKKLKLTKRKKIGLVVLAVVVLVCFWALYSKRLSQRSQILARVGNGYITADDFQKELLRQPFADQVYLETLPGKKELLELLIRRKVVLSEAQRAGFYRDPDVKKQISEVREALRWESKKAEERILVSNFFRYLQERDIQVTDEEAKAFWDSEVEAQVSHILVNTSTVAHKILSQVRAGEDFARLARKFSEDTGSSREGGDLGYFMRGTLVPEVEEASFGLKLGKVSDVIKSQYGYHILLKTGERKLSARPFSDVAERIRMVLEKQKFQAWVERAKQRCKISVDESALDLAKSQRAYYDASSRGRKNGKEIESPE